MFRLGNSTILKIQDVEVNRFTLGQLLRTSHSENPRERDPEVRATAFTQEVSLSVHSWLVHHEGMNILIDSGAGNEKSRSIEDPLGGLQTRYLERLAAAGVTPESIHYVLHTHLHADHVGWNTSRAGEMWVPTFPKALTLCSKREWKYQAALASCDFEYADSLCEEAGLETALCRPPTESFRDSMLPLSESGGVCLLESMGEEVLPGITFLRCPGHSIDHAAIEISSEGRKAIFSGDAMHHPLEIDDLGLASCFCEFPKAACRSRAELLDYAARNKALVLTAHFPGSSAGFVNTSEDGYAWSMIVDPNDPTGVCADVS